MEFGILMLLLVVVGVLFYFLPTLVAWNRHKRNTVAIFLLNLFLGWTLVGWVVSLVWAVSVDKN